MTTTDTESHEGNEDVAGEPRRSERKLAESEANMLRNEPVQLRSAATLAKLEASAVAMIAQHGRDGFTTKHIADHAGVSIGTSYRYFVDRKAVLDWVYPDHVEGLGEPRKAVGQPQKPTAG